MRHARLLSVTTILLCVSLPLAAAEKQSPAQRLLDAAIGYHDPRAAWADSVWRLTLEEARPTGGGRSTVLLFDSAGERFEWRRDEDGRTSEGRLNGGDCELRLDGELDFGAEERDRYRLTCDRLRWWRDYYGYLWGLPMKLRDPGTILDPEVRETEFDGKPVLAIKVTYEEAVGGDTWYFYFDPDTKGLTGYRFYHDEAANDGEYVLLRGEVAAQGLRLPRARTWYTHLEDELLGTDTLLRLERLDAAESEDR